MDLELQLAVERLHAQYVHALDADKLEDWPDFFTENGRYRIATAENEERGLPLPVLSAEGRGMMRDRIQSLRHANIYEPQRYRHMVSARSGGKDVRAGSDDRPPTSSSSASCRTATPSSSPAAATSTASPFPSLKYDERVVICDSRRFDTLLAIPL